MKILSFFLLIGVLPIGQSHAEEILIMGRAIAQTSIQGVESPCPPDRICFNSWSRWEIEVERTVGSTPLPNRIYAASYDHGQFTDAYLDKLRAFVIRPITDANARRLLAADYRILDRSIGHEMVCFSEKPKDVKDVPFYVSEHRNGWKFCIESEKK